MKLKITVGQIVREPFRAAFAKLVAEPSIHNLKGEAWALARTQRQIEGYFQDFVAARLNIAKQLGKLDEAHPEAGYTIPPDRQAEFLGALNEMAEKEVELYLDHKILLPEPLPLTSQLGPQDVLSLLDVIDSLPKEVIQLDQNENRSNPSAPAGLAAS